MEISRHWRLHKERLRLEGKECKCGCKTFPPREVCPKCKGVINVPYQFSGKGEVYSFTKITQAAQGFEQYTPYILAIIKLEEGPLLTAQITDTQTIDIGQKVKMVIRKVRENGDRGVIEYGYKFRPLLLNQ